MQIFRKLALFPGSRGAERARGDPGRSFEARGENYAHGGSLEIKSGLESARDGGSYGESH